MDGTSKAQVDCGPGDDTLYLAIDANATEDYVGVRSLSGYRNCETIWNTDALQDPNTGVTYLARDAGGRREGTSRDDTLLGGPGADALYGRAGNDVLWGLRQPGVTSSAADVLVAGPGDDTVYGGPGPQRIEGGPGDDLLESGIGDGTISGGSGADTIRLRGGGLTKVDAGPGNDTIYARGTARAQIRCGAGRDVANVDAGDRVARDCERVVGRSAKPVAKIRTTYPDVIAATPGLAHWWRLGERAPAGTYVSLDDEVPDTYATGSYFGAQLGAPGVTDDANTAIQNSATYFAGAPFLTFRASDMILHGAFTFEGWFRSDDSGTRRALLGDVYGTTLEGVALVREAGDALHAVIASSDDPSRRVDLTTPALNLAPYSWHHVALTRADDRVAIYVDGALRAQAAATPVTFDTTEYTIGVGGPVGGYKLWVGAIDEVALYDRALDAATILAHAHAGDDDTPPVARADPPLVGTQPRSAVLHLTTDEAGSSFHCSLDGARVVACPSDYALANVRDGAHVLRVLATSRTGVVQVAPTVLSFDVDASVPGTLLVLRLAAHDDGRAIASFASDSVTSFECRRASDPTLDGGFEPCGAPLDLPAGSRLEVRAVDAAGNRDPSPAFVQVPPAGRGFPDGLELPTFAGARAQAQLQGEGLFSTGFQCLIDGGDWAACPSDYRLPILDPGTHTLRVRQRFGSGRPFATTPAMTWTVAPRAGDVAIAGLQGPLVVEHGARLLRRAPRVRFALSHPAAVALDVLRRGRTPVIHVAARGRTGANVVKIGAHALLRLREGRYAVRLSARGATGRTTVQQLPLAIVPPLR